MMNEEILTQKIALYRGALLDCAKHLSNAYLDSRYNEISMAHVMATLVRHNVWANEAEENVTEGEEAIDLLFPDGVPDKERELIQKFGASIAQIYFSKPAHPMKDDLLEIAATILVCSRMITDRICTDLTTFEDRTALVNTAIPLLGDTMMTMVLALSDPQPSSLV